MKRAILIAMAVLNALAIYPLTVYKDGGVDYVTATYDSVVFRPAETLSGNFSVSPTQQVNFMLGNVVYENSEWRIESEQWKEGSKFYWSGNLNPYGLSECSDSYWTGGGERKNPSYYLNDLISSSTGYSFVDWGEKFDDGWYTMSRQEWWHLLYGRDNAENLFSYATVCGVKGLLLLPDDFVNPGVPFYPLEFDYSVNDYGLEDWMVLEMAGAVFLPEAQCWLSDGDFIYYGIDSVANHSILFPDTLSDYDRALFPDNVFDYDDYDYLYDSPCDAWDELRKNELEDISEYYGVEMICKHRNLLLLKSMIGYGAPTLKKTYVRLVRPSGYLSDTEKPVIHTLSKSEDLGHDPVAKEPKFIAKDNCDKSVEVKVTTSGVEKVGDGKRQTWVATAVDAAGNVADEVKITYSWTGELSFLAQEFSVSPSKKVLFSPGNLMVDSYDEEYNPTNYRFSSLPLKFFYIDYYDYIEEFFYAPGDYDVGCTSLVYMGKFTEYGEQMGDGWHTLSQKEWDYLFYGRENAENLFRSVKISPDTILKVMGDPYKQVANHYNFSIEGLDYDLSELNWEDFKEWLDNSGSLRYDTRCRIILPDDCPSDFRTIASETVADLKKLIDLGAVFIPWNSYGGYMTTMPMGGYWSTYSVRLVWGEK